MYTLFIILFRISNLNDDLQKYNELFLKSFEESNNLFKKITNEKENANTLMYLVFMMNQIFCKNKRDINGKFKKVLEKNLLNLIKKKHSLLFKKNNEEFFKEENEKLLNLISKGQKYYNSFTKLAKIFRLSKEVKITSDLLLNPIDRKMKNIIIINQNKINYIFTFKDLINIIETNLCNSPDYFADPLEIKNPYNNLKFDKGILYTIYFKIKDSCYVLPNLFHNYFLCNFNMELFSVENESLIRDTNLKRIINNSSISVLFKNIKRMLKSDNNTNTYTISSDINKKEFVEIMKPYYYLYLMSNYHISGLEKTRFSHILLKRKLIELFEYNPQFGRTKMKRTDPINNPTKWEEISDLEHPKFTMKEAKETSLKHYTGNDSLNIYY